jgi:Tol biopolymer transport system component
MALYSAAWEGQPSQTFETRFEGTGERRVDVTGEIQSISARGEMALIIDRYAIFGLEDAGTLATAPLSGGAPREMLASVGGADWAPDGQQLAITRHDPTIDQWALEYPVGTVLYQTANWVDHPRVSRDGTRVAVLEHERRGDNRGYVTVVSTTKVRQKLTGAYAAIVGCVWSPVGDEIWFSANSTGSRTEALAVNMSGAIRRLLDIPAAVIVEDVRQDGRMLLQTQSLKGRMLLKRVGSTAERDLTWFDYPLLNDLASDGSLVLFTEVGQGGGRNYSVFVRSTEGNQPALRIAEGSGIRLSPDRKFVLLGPADPNSRFSIVPIGAGAKSEITLELETVAPGSIRWSSDAKRLILNGSVPGRPRRTFEYTIASKQLLALTPEGVAGTLMSPDGRQLVVTDQDGVRFLWRTDRGDRAPLPSSVAAEDSIVNWSNDARSLFVAARDTGVRRREIFRVDTVTNQKQSLGVYGPSDTAGIGSLFQPAISADGRVYVYRYLQTFSDLFVSDVRR